LRSCEESFADEFVLIICAEGLKELWQIACAKEFIDVGNFFFQFRFVALAQAARDDELFDVTIFFSLRIFENGVDAFLLGIINKATGVYYDNFGFALTFMGNVHFVSPQLSHQYFAVEDILGAAEGDYVNSVLFEGFRLHLISGGEGKVD
jgi:hypothetical protein